MVKRVNQFEIFLVALNPTRGAEINKVRPCVIISPNEMNRNIQTIIIAPMTTQERNYPTRIPILFENKKGHIILDQIRAVDKSRLIKKVGVVPNEIAEYVLEILQIMFSKKAKA